MKFEIRNVRSSYSAGSLVSVSKELSKYKFDLVGGRWLLASRKHIFYGKRNEDP
jgi:hypothetical protein